MKKSLLLVFVLSSLLLVSCMTSFDRTLLQPSPSAIDPKLLNLELKNGNSDFSVGRTNSKSLSANTYLYTIFERECENNLIEWEGDEKWGTIDLVIIDASYDRVDEWSFSTNVYVEFELRIYDINGKKIWSNQFFKEGGTIVVWTGAQVESEAQTRIVLTFKELIEEAKVALRKDVPGIITTLRETLANQK